MDVMSCYPDDFHINIVYSSLCLVNIRDTNIFREAS